ncbi:MAG: leucyl aminopeptidase family protein [Chlamydiales bacterium]|nr:leucyl aminopeptidase family protein [Chlamydiales bacterium]
MKIGFLDLEALPEADLLIVCNEAVEAALDKKLNGALRFNQAKGIKRMTTNGAYPVSQIVFARKEEPLAPLATCERVAVAGASEEAIFQLLLKCPELDLTVLCKNPIEREEAFERDACLLGAIRRAKELIAAPANRLPPEAFAKKCLELEGVKVDVYDEEELERIGASALLAVGRGSLHPPRMVVLEYKGAEGKPLLLVGKGVCYDSGGINLKRSHLTEMKWDKAGAGVVVGALDACARLKLPIHVVGILVLAENMPDGAALKPGDVISTLGGKEVEIVDTDCEGRLMLADGLVYAQKFAPRTLIDLGTLTPETFGALGGAYAGLFCSDSTLSRSLIEAGEEVSERVWPLPLGEVFADQLKSKIADLKNAGIPRYGAAPASAEFLKAFVNLSLPYAHIDIAGVSWNPDDPEQGVTGFGVRLLVRYIEKLVKYLI